MPSVVKPRSLSVLESSVPLQACTLLLQVITWWTRVCVVRCCKPARCCYLQTCSLTNRNCLCKAGALTSQGIHSNRASKQDPRWRYKPMAHAATYRDSICTADRPQNTRPSLSLSAPISGLPPPHPPPPTTWIVKWEIPWVTTFRLSL